MSPTARAAPAVEVLRCAGCRAPLPLGRGDAIACPFCGLRNEIPPRYRALRDAAVEDARALAEAEALYRRVGRPPGRIARALALPGGLVLFFWFGWLVVAGTLCFGLKIGLRALGRHLGANLDDCLRPVEHGLVYGGGTLLLLGALAIAGAWGRRSAQAWRELQAALAAKPPERPGGSARCRACDAPLLVDGGALGVRCSYCRADNLVALPPAWTAVATSDARRLERSIARAVELERSERGAWVLSAIARVVPMTAFPSLIVTLAAVGDIPRPVWRDAIADSPRRLYAWGRGPLHPSAEDTPAVATVDGKPHRAERSELSYRLPLRRGERLVVRLDALDPSLVAAGEHVTVRASTESLAGWRWGEMETVGEGAIARGDELAVTAPRDAWYLVELTPPWRAGADHLTFSTRIAP